MFRIPPYHYLHVLDQNLNVTRVELGPKTFVRQDHEKVLLGPNKMVVVPPKYYCIVENPVILDATTRQPVLDKHQQYKLRHADQEVRLEQDPFPLYPGEALVQGPTPLQVVKQNTALRLRAIRDYVETTANGQDVQHPAGDEWLFPGAATYIPNVSVEVVETISATVIAPNQALRLRARLDCVSKSDGKNRVAGEEWHVTNPGAYLPHAYEEVLRLENAHVLTEKTALHLKAVRTFVDEYGKQRRNGEEWLVTSRESETHIPNVYEHVVGTVNLITLTNRQYCVVTNPVNADGVPQLGQQKLIKGEKSFFLQPGESLRSGIQDVFVLGEEESLVLRASEEYEDVQPDGTVVRRKPGDRWTVQGPCEYFPAVQIEVLARRCVAFTGERRGRARMDAGRPRRARGVVFPFSPLFFLVGGLD